MLSRSFSFNVFSPDWIVILTAIDFFPSGIFSPSKTSNTLTDFINLLSTDLIILTNSWDLKFLLIINAKSLSDFWKSDNLYSDF